MRIQIAPGVEIELEGWSITRGVKEIADFNDPQAVTRVHDGTVTITGRIVGASAQSGMVSSAPPTMDRAGLSGRSPNVLVADSPPPKKK